MTEKVFLFLDEVSVSGVGVGRVWFRVFICFESYVVIVSIVY